MTKSIIVPKDANALQALNFDTAEDDRLYQMVLDDEHFKLLWDTGIFEEINKLAGSLIDWYEDEEITDPDIIANVHGTLFPNKMEHEKSDALMDHLRLMFKRAHDLKTGIFFYF